MPAQGLDDLDSPGHRRAEVPRARHQVALVDVVGPNAGPDQLVDQLLHHVRAIVDPRQEDRLAAQRDAGVGQPGTGPADLGRHLLRVVEVDVHPQWVIAAQHGHQVIVDPLRQEDGNPCSDPHHLDVGNRPQSPQQVLQDALRQHQRISARQQDVAHRRRVGDVVDLGLVVGAAELGTRIADDAAASTVAAVAGTLGGDQHQYPIWVAVYQPRHRRVGLFTQGVDDRGLEAGQLAAGGDDLAANGTRGVIRVDQGGKVGGDVEAEAVLGTDTFLLLGRQANDLSQLLEGVQTMAELPAPVVPLRVGHIGPRLPSGGSWGGLLLTPAIHLLRICLLHLALLAFRLSSPDLRMDSPQNHHLVNAAGSRERR